MCSSRADPMAQPLHSASRWCSASCDFPASQLMSRSLTTLGRWAWGKGRNLIQTVYWDLHIHQKSHSTSKAFQGRVMLHKQMWTFPPMFNLCLLSPWGSNSKKMTLKGYDFLLHTKLVILGLLFLFPLFYSLSPLPSPEQKRSYISSGSVFTGDSFFFLLLTTFFS